MISVSDALSHLFDLVTATEVEAVPLRQAAGRVLASDVVATRTQPPFAASSMDGYALRQTEVEPDAMFKVIGEAAAGHRFDGVVKAGQAVRIFTGAPVPEGADFVVIQEDTTRRGDLIMLGHDIGPKTNIRPAGGDFHAGDTLDAPRLLRPADIALLASMNVATVPVYAKPRVAIIATGDELVQPGEVPNPDQIIASNTYGLAALLETPRRHAAPGRATPERFRAGVMDHFGIGDTVARINALAAGDINMAQKPDSKAFNQVEETEGINLLSVVSGGYVGFVLMQDRPPATTRTS